MPRVTRTRSRSEVQNSAAPEFIEANRRQGRYQNARIAASPLGTLACCTRQELARQVDYLKEENRILRSQLPKTVKTTAQEKRRLVRAGKRLGLQLKSLISIVSYETFRRWVREAEQRHLQNQFPRKTGRPLGSEGRIPKKLQRQEIQELVSFYHFRNLLQTVAFRCKSSHFVAVVGPLSGSETVDVSR